ncbi:MAG: helix-turn-helix domain-containing protein [Verrucomicrobiota bacterium]|jgi:hypothetical protein
MSKQNTITTEAQLREAVREHWTRDSALNWRWKEWEPHHDQGIDAIGELILDKQRVTFAVEFKLNPAARDVEFLAKQKHQYPLLLIAPNISETLVRLCREKGVNCADLNGRLWLRTKGLLVERSAKSPRFRPAVVSPDPFSVKSSRLVRTLLSQRGREWIHKELVKRTGLSKGLVSRLTRHLVEQGLLAQEERALKVKQWDGLLDAWAAQDDWQKRTTLRQYSLLESDLEEVARRLLKIFPCGEALVFTQWFAANLRHPYTIPPVVSAYATRFPGEQIERELGARQVTDGGTLWLVVPKDDGVFRETQRVGEFTLACDAQIYLDLVRAGLRGPDQAQALREWNGFGRVKA